MSFPISIRLIFARHKPERKLRVPLQPRRIQSIIEDNEAKERGRGGRGSLIKLT